MTFQKFIRLLASSGYTPRWCVCMLDIVVISAIYLSVNYFTQILSGIDRVSMIDAIGFMLFLLWYVAGILLFRTYAGIVRYAGISDTFRLSGMIATVVVGQEITSAVIQIVSGNGLWNPLLPIVNGFVIFGILFLIRLTVKLFFQRYIASANKNRKTVFIYGVDADSMLLCSMLKAEIGEAYYPTGLIDPTGEHAGKNIGGVPIYDGSQQLLSHFTRHAVDSLLVPDSQLSRLRQQGQELIESDIHILTVAHFQDIETTKRKSGSLSSQVHNIQIEDLLGREPIKTDMEHLRETLQGKVVLVTGAAGSIGSEISRQVASFNPEKLLLLDQAESPLYEIHLEISKKYPHLHVEALIGDITNRKRMRLYFNTYKPQYVYHAAAYKHVPMMEAYPAEAVRVNVGGTKNIADLSVEYGVRKFVMVSTDKAVNPTNVMGTSKRMAEIYVQSLFYHLKGEEGKYTRFITTRFGNVLGSNGSVVPLFKRQIAEGGPVTLTHKDITRYFMTISEACNLVLEAGCMGKGGEIFIFDMGKPIKIYDLAKRMITLSGLKPGIDVEIVETGLRPGEKLYEELLNDAEKTLPTHHPKIKVAQVRKYNFQDVSVQVGEVVRLSKAIVTDGTFTNNPEQSTLMHNMRIVLGMKALVPEFKSKNSVFESLDA